MHERLDVVDQRRPAEVALLRRERRAQARHPATALHRLEHRRLLAADVRAGADDDVDVEPACRDRLAQARARGRVLLAQVDVGLVHLAEAHRRDEPLEQQLRPELHHVAVLDRPGLALVGVDDHGPRGGLAADRVPLAEGREAGTAHPGQPGRLEPRQHLVRRELGRVARVVRLREEAVRAVGDAAPHGLAVHHDGGEVAVAEARDSKCAVQPSRPCSRTPARCRHAPRPPAPGGTSRTRRPRAPRRGGCSSSRRARRRARA